MLLGQEVCEPVVDLANDGLLRLGWPLQFGDRGSFFTRGNPWLRHARHLTVAMTNVQPRRCAFQRTHVLSGIQLIAACSHHPASALVDGLSLLPEPEQDCLGDVLCLNE